MSDGEVKIHISTTAELEALRQMEGDLQRNIVKLEVLKATLTDADKIKLESLKKELASVQGALGNISGWKKAGAEILGFAEKIPGVGEAMRAMNGATGALSAGFVGVSLAAGAAYKAVTVFEEAEHRLVGLRAALALSGQANTENEASLRQLVTAQKEFAIAGSESIPVIETLLKLGRIRAADVPREFEAVKGLAAITGQDLTSAAHLYSMALEGNITRLQRWLPELRGVKDEEEKLRIARTRLTEAAKAYDAQAEDGIGVHKKLGIAVSDLIAKIGQQISYTDSVRVLAETFKWWGNQLPAVESKIQPINSALADMGRISPDVVEQLRLLGNTAHLALGEDENGLETALDGVAEKTDKVNKGLEETLRLQNELHDAETQVKLAQLRVDESQALAGAKTPADRKLIEAQYAEKRRAVEAANKLAAAEAEAALRHDQQVNAKVALAPIQEGQRQRIEARDQTAAAANDYQAEADPPKLQAKDRKIIATWQRTQQDLQEARDEEVAGLEERDSSPEAKKALAALAKQKPSYEAAQGRTDHLAELQAAAALAAKNLADFNANEGANLKKLTAALSEADLREQVATARVTAAKGNQTADAAQGGEKIREAQQGVAKQQRADQILAQEAILKNPQSTGAQITTAAKEKLRLKAVDAEPGKLDELIGEAQKEIHDFYSRQIKAENQALHKTRQQEISAVEAEISGLGKGGKHAPLKTREELAVLHKKLQALRGDQGGLSGDLAPVPSADELRAAATGQPWASAPKPVPQLTRGRFETVPEFQNRQAAAATTAQTTAKADLPVPQEMPAPPKSTAAQEISRGDEIPAPPKPLDVSQISGPLQNYFAANEAQHVQTDAEIAALSEQIAGATAALANLKGNVREGMNA